MIKGGSKMATKNCPKCESPNPVACKKCVCGYTFFATRRSANALPVEHNEEMDGSHEAGIPRRRTGRVTRERPQFYDALQVENQSRRQRELQKRRKASKSDDPEVVAEDSNVEKASAVTSTPPAKRRAESPPPKAAEPIIKKRRGRPPALGGRKSGRAQILATKPIDSSLKHDNANVGVDALAEETENVYDVSPIKVLQMNMVLSDINSRMYTSGVKADAALPQIVACSQEEKVEFVVDAESDNVAVKLKVEQDAGKGSAKNEQIGKEPVKKEQIGKESAKKEQAGKESPKKEQVGKDSPAKDPVGKELPVKEQVGKKQVGKDSPTKDPVGKDSPAKEQVGKDSPAKDPVGKESPVKEQVGKNSHAKDPVGKDSPTKDPVGKESPVKKQIGKESPAKEQVGKESNTKDPIGKESPVKEQVGKDSPAKDSVGKESPVKEQVGKDSPAKDSVGKESPVKEQVGKDSFGKEPVKMEGSENERDLEELVPMEQIPEELPVKKSNKVDDNSENLDKTEKDVKLNVEKKAEPCEKMNGVENANECKDASADAEVDNGGKETAKKSKAANAKVYVEINCSSPESSFGCAYPTHGF